MKTADDKLTRGKIPGSRWYRAHCRFCSCPIRVQTPLSLAECGHCVQSLGKNVYIEDIDAFKLYSPVWSERY